MARRLKAWHTPDDGDTTVVRGCLEIPTPLLPMVMGALAMLTETWNWEQVGTMTPAEAAEAATRMLFAFQDGTCDDMNCEDVLACMLPYLQANLYDDAAIRLHPTTEQPQVSYDGGTTWTDIPQTGNGTINAPTPTPTAGANDAVKICLASTRAALVLAEFYKQTFGAFTADVMNALGTANNFLQDIKMVLFNAIYSPYDGIIEAAGFLEQDFETNYTAGTLSETNIEDLLCLLVSNASVDENGVVTFDFGAVAANVITDVGANPGTALWFLLQNMQSAGLNAAASTAITDTALDCDACLDCVAGNVRAEYPTWNSMTRLLGTFYADVLRGVAEGYINPTGYHWTWRVRITLPQTQRVTSVTIDVNAGGVARQLVVSDGDNNTQLAATNQASGRRLVTLNMPPDTWTSSLIVYGTVTHWNPSPAQLNDMYDIQVNWDC